MPLKPVARQPLTHAQKQELDRRLEHYQEDPTASSTWKAVKQ
jgi:putative addiction module component (TIGR02574 family)